MSTSIEFKTKEINDIICQNITKMLKRRKLIEDDEILYNQIKDDFSNKSTIEFTLLDNSKCSVNIINVKLNSIVQGTPLDDYLSNDINIHKIIIIKDMSKKVLKQIINDYKNAEIFFEHEMLQDIPSYVLIPEHQLLSEEEKRELLTNFNENELSIIFSVDIMARYYNTKVGDIFRIIRPSITSGKSIFYRRVHAGNIDVLFS